MCARAQPENAGDGDGTRGVGGTVRGRTVAGLLFSRPMPTSETAVPDDAAADLATLERFVLESDDLLALKERIGRFNIFDGLGIARRELQHSNFLAWLLDPAESHGQGDLFLRAVLMDMMRSAREQGIEPPVSPVLLDGDELGGVEIRREWKSLDLVIDVDRPSLLVAIENKVNSGEHSDQLARYEGTLDREFGERRRRLCVFLTPDGAEPSRKMWVAYSYTELHAVLHRCGSRTGNDRARRRHVSGALLGSHREPVHERSADRGSMQKDLHESSARD